MKDRLEVIKKSENFSEFCTKFELIFDSKPNPDRLAALIRLWGENKIDLILDELLIIGVKPLKEGKRNNPYGLIFSCAKHDYITK